MPLSANDRLLARAVAHRLGIERLSAGMAERMIAVLDAADAELVERLSARVARAAALGFDPGPTTTRRLERIIEDLRTINRAAYQRVGRELRAELVDLGEYEVDQAARSIREAVPAKITLDLETVPALAQIAAIVDAEPFNGLILKDWVADLAAGRLANLKRTINTGILEGVGPEVIVRRVVGTRGTKGILDISRQHARTWVRTAVSHTMNSARDKLWDANAKLIQAIMWLATLDTRTSRECLVRDRLLYTLEREPIDHAVPWGSGPGRLHPRCRSTSTPLLRSAQELGIDTKALSPQTRASMDGQVPASTNLRQLTERWAKTDPDRAAALIGRRRVSLIQGGKLDLDDLIKGNGEFWTLAELRRRERAAFEAVGR